MERGFTHGLKSGGKCRVISTLAVQVLSGLSPAVMVSSMVRLCLFTVGVAAGVHALSSEMVTRGARG